ncbi:MAG: YbhB/YbcL family Raf kinase inhibitor-like protein [Candidatus Omnitrophota bacterium]
MKLTSPAFSHNQSIPKKYTCQGENISPPLKVEGIPPETKSLSLIIDDPDAPGGNFDHWIVFNIPVVSEIKEDAIPGLQGSNDFGKLDYGGPCPPSGTHRYFHKVYALDTMLKLNEGVSKKQVEKAMEGHILEMAELIGLYKKERSF